MCEIQKPMVEKRLNTKTPVLFIHICWKKKNNLFSWATMHIFMLPEMMMFLCFINCKINKHLLQKLVFSHNYVQNAKKVAIIIHYILCTFEMRGMSFTYIWLFIPKWIFLNTGGGRYCGLPPSFPPSTLWRNKIYNR